ncbi:hypothetical protein HXZ94_13255 [Empedobacter falsenii]|nr:hypothetical protein [Empedobacter falsenii]
MAMLDNYETKNIILYSIMSHLNYFLPYNKGTNHHEDHLTRAFLVLLKHSNTTLQQFYSYVFYTLGNSFDSFKPLHQFPLTEINFETQVGSLPEADTYVSILITNDTLIINKEIVPIERTPIYDGVIDFNSELVFFIETKPNKENVWENQLCPAKKDIPIEAELLKSVAVLEWKEIINILHRINESNITSYQDKLLINDFFELINLNFDYLNPFNDFSKCRSSYLANKRIEQILKEISFTSDKVKHHSGWGYYIELDFPEIRKIALLLHTDNTDNWKGLTVAADFGSTVSQARAFYSKIQSHKAIMDLSDFDAYCNLHLAFKNQNLVFLKSPEDCLPRYFDYWKSDVRDNFGGVLKDKLNNSYLNEYVDKGILIYNQDKQDEVTNVIMNKGYTRINICPAIYVEHYISKDEATNLDKVGKLIPHITTKMKEVLNILEHSLNGILN